VKQTTIQLYKYFYLVIFEAFQFRNIFIPIYAITTFHVHISPFTVIISIIMIINAA